MLNVLIFLPLVGGLLIWAILGARRRLARGFVLGVALLELAVCLLLFAQLGSGGSMISSSFPWMPSLGIQYLVGLDGLSLTLALLTAVVTLGALLVAWETVEDWARFGALVLVTEGAIMGVLTALDLLLFYLFWELMVIPIFFLIARRGGAARIAAMRFFLFTIVGSLLMLLSIVGLYLIHGRLTGQYSFDYFALRHTTMANTTSLWLMLGMLAAFAVKIPMFPLHLWAPEAYTQAEAPVTILLAGAMANAGAYGVLRFCLPLFPAGVHAFAPLGMILGAIGVVYGGLLALVQNDIRRVIAYASISHMSLVVLGLFAWQQQALSGAVFLLVAHGLEVLGLFAVTAWLEARGLSPQLDAAGGWFRLMPRMGIFLLIVMLSGIGLPGLAGFVGEFLVLAGSVQRVLIVGSVAALGIVISVMYFLRAYERSMLGPLRDTVTASDLGIRETVVMGTTAVLLVGLGLYPQALLSPIGAITATLARMH